MQIRPNFENGTYLEIVEVFESIAANHGQINSFKEGQLYDFDVTTVQNYPLLFLEVKPAVFPLNSYQSYSTVMQTVNLTIADLVNPEDGLQMREVLSNMRDVLWDIIFLATDRHELTATGNISVKPFVEYKDDRVAGWTADFTFVIPRTFGWCDAPFKGANCSGSTYMGPYNINCGDNCISNLFYEDTASVSFLGNGAVCSPLQAFVNLSATSGNTLTILPDGLFASGGTKVPSIPSTQVAFGDINNLLTSSPDFTFDPTGDGFLTVVAGSVVLEGDGYNVAFTNSDINLQSSNGPLLFTGQPVVFTGLNDGNSIVFNATGNSVFNSGGVQVVGFASSGTTMVVAGPDGTLSTEPIPSPVTPAGSNTDIQFNNSGVFGATPRLTWNNSSDLFAVSGTTNISGLVSIGNPSAAGYTSLLNVNGNIQAASIDFVGAGNSTAWSNWSSISTYARQVNLGNAQYGDFIEDLTSVYVSAGFKGYASMYATPYMYGATSGQNPGSGAYVAGFSSLPVYDNAGASTPLQFMYGYNSALNVQSGTVSQAFDYNCYELNTDGRVTNPNPSVTNHYNFYAASATKAVNNYGIYINGPQANFFGGTITSNTLSGSTTQMVVATAGGTLSVQSIPTSPVLSVFGRTGNVVLLSSDVTTALGFTPYNATNPSGYISSITGAMVTTALGYTPANVGSVNGILKANGAGTISQAVAGTDYQTPLTFSTGLTNNSGTVTGNLSTGVSGGQTAFGGTASGNSLTLSSTSNATKGDIYFGSAQTSFFNEANNYLQIENNNLGSTLTSGLTGLILTNTTPATSGQTQVSPGIIFSGQSWETLSAGASETVQALMYFAPANGTSPSTVGGNLNLAFDINNTWTNGFQFSAIATGWTFGSAGLTINPIGGAGISLSSLPATANQFHINSGFTIEMVTALTTGIGVSFTDAGSTTTTSGNATAYQFANTFAPTTGNATFALTVLQPTINQTGGASGTTRGLYIQPTITAAADFRALEVSAGKSIFAPSTTGSTSINIPSGTAPSSPNGGDVWYDGSHFNGRAGSNTRRLDSSVDLLSSGSVSGATEMDIDLSSYISTYSRIVIQLSSVKVSTSSVTLQAQVSPLTSYDTGGTNYGWSTFFLTNSGAGSGNVGASTGDSSMTIANALGTTTKSGTCGTFEVFNPNSNALQPTYRWNFVATNSDTNITQLQGIGIRYNQQITNKVRFIVNTGTFSGSYTVTGYV